MKTCEEQWDQIKMSNVMLIAENMIYIIITVNIYLVCRNTTLWITAQRNIFWNISSSLSSVYTSFNFVLIFSVKNLILFCSNSLGKWIYKYGIYEMFEISHSRLINDQYYLKLQLQQTLENSETNILYI